MVFRILWFWEIHFYCRNCKKIGKIRWENTFKMQNCFLNGVEIKMLHFICKYVCKMYWIFWNYIYGAEMKNKCSKVGRNYIINTELINKWCLEFYGSGKYIFLQKWIENVGPSMEQRDSGHRRERMRARRLTVRELRNASWWGKWPEIILFRK